MAHRQQRPSDLGYGLPWRACLCEETLRDYEPSYCQILGSVVYAATRKFVCNDGCCPVVTTAAVAQRSGPPSFRPKKSCFQKFSMPWEISPGISIGLDERSPGSAFANEPRPFAGVQSEIPAMAYSLKAEFARRERRAESDLLLFVLLLDAVPVASPAARGRAADPLLYVRLCPVSENFMYVMLSLQDTKDTS